MKYQIWSCSRDINCCNRANIKRILKLVFILIFNLNLEKLRNKLTWIKRKQFLTKLQQKKKFQAFHTNALAINSKINISNFIQLKFFDVCDVWTRKDHVTYGCLQSIRWKWFECAKIHPIATAHHLFCVRCQSLCDI